MKAWQSILVIIALAISFVCGYQCRGEKVKTITEKDRDTIYVPQKQFVPYPVSVNSIMEVPELYPMYITLGGDTVHEQIYVPVLISQKEYKTDDYHLWISGNNPNLDSIYTFNKEIYIREKPRRFGIGLSAGYGIGKNGLSPYIGIGGYYRIW